MRKVLMLMCLLLALGVAMAEGDVLRIENGAPQPILEVSPMRVNDYTNEDSDILRFCVYVETDHDTDGDGLADLVKALVQVPRPAAEGQYKAATIYNPTPYNAGTYNLDYTEMYNKVSFDFEKLSRPGEKRTPAGEQTTLEAAAAVQSSEDWIYTIPVPEKDGSAQVSFYESGCYDYYLARGYAYVMCCGIGTFGSEGFELCATALERDSHKAVVEWLTGDRVAYTDKKSNIAIKADWSNGNVAMTGVSYGGTLPFEVATTGVKGLKTIIPYAGIASWYDYTNSQGVPLMASANYTEYLAASCSGATFKDRDWTVFDRDYGAWLWSIAEKEKEANGNYTDLWQEYDYTRDWANIKCSALIGQGLNDLNVTPRHADLMAEAFRKAGQNFKLILYQDGHTTPHNTLVQGELWNEIENRWLAHYLYDIDNGTENMPAVLVQSNIDGQYAAYDSWRDFKYIEAPVGYDEDETTVTTEGLAEFASLYVSSDNGYEGVVEEMEAYYLSLENNRAAYYYLELPENTTVYGVPEVHLKLSTEKTEYEGLMISAILLDVANDGGPFPAYQLKTRLGNKPPVRVIGKYEGQSLDYSNDITEFVQDYVYGKLVSYGYTDLANPGGGIDNSDYAEDADLESGVYYDYTFYMSPNVYTIAPGHSLLLVLTTWDPYRAFLDESFIIDPTIENENIDYDYSYTIDNNAIDVRIPVR